MRDVLLSESSEHRAALLEPLEDQDYLVATDELADELVGLAPHLYVLDGNSITFWLTDLRGDRRLSCFFGALRVYLPGFSCADRSEYHRLLLRDRLADPVVRAKLVGRLGQTAARRVRMRPGTTVPPALHNEAPLARAARAPPEAAPRQVAAPAVTASAVAPPVYSMVAPAFTSDSVTAPDQAALGAELPTVRAGLGAQIGALAATIGCLVDANATLRDGIARLRTTTALQAASTTARERRIGSLELLQPHAQAAPATEQADTRADAAAAAVAAAEDDERITLVDVLRQATKAHGGMRSSSWTPPSGRRPIARTGTSTV